MRHRVPSHFNWTLKQTLWYQHLRACPPLVFKVSQAFTIWSCIGLHTRQFRIHLTVRTSATRYTSRNKRLPRHAITRSSTNITSSRNFTFPKHISSLILQFFQQIQFHFTASIVKSERNGMGRECSAYGVEESRIQSFRGETPLGRPRSRWVDKLWWIFRKWGVGVWTGSSWLRIGTSGGAIVNVVMNLRVP